MRQWININYCFFIVFATAHSCYRIRECNQNENRAAGLKFAIIEALAALAVCAASTAFSVIKPGVFQPFWFEDFLLIDLSAGLAVLFTWRTRAATSRRLLFGICALAVSAFATLFTCEIFLRTFYISKLPDNKIGRVFQRDYNNSVDTMLHKPIPSASDLKRLNARKETLANVFQLRDQHVIPAPGKKATETRVMWLGDSMTEGAQVPLEKRFTRLLEISTGLPQYSLAVGGTSSDYAQAMLHRYFGTIKPDIVILGFYPLNDYEEFGRQLADCGFASLYEPDGAGFRYTCDEGPRPMFYSVFLQPPGLILSLAAQTTVFGNIMMDARNNIYQWIAGKRYYKPNPFQPKRKMSAMQLIRYMEKLKKTGEKNDLKKDYLPAEKAVCSMVNEINKSAVSRGAAFAVVMLPYVLGDKRYDNDKVLGFYPPQASGEAFQKCMSRNDIPFFNLQTAIDEKQLDINNKDTVFLLDRHFNEKGHKRAAELLLPFERKLIGLTKKHSNHR